MNTFARGICLTALAVAALAGTSFTTKARSLSAQNWVLE